jgi:rubredoxin
MKARRRISTYDNSDTAYKHYNKLAEFIAVNSMDVTPEEVGDKLFQATRPRMAMGADKRQEIEEVKAAREWLETEYARARGGAPLETTEIESVPHNVPCPECSRPTDVTSSSRVAVSSCPECDVQVTQYKGDSDLPMILYGENKWARRKASASTIQSVADSFMENPYRCSSCGWIGPFRECRMRSGESQLLCNECCRPVYKVK